jgi:outer membrane protein OmpA-like peptidoglycan-associated protein
MTPHDTPSSTNAPSAEVWQVSRIHSGGTRMFAAIRLVMWGLIALGSPAGAQSPQVLQGDAITEPALVDALTPPVVTRSIDPSAPAKPAKASLLITFEPNATTLTAAARRELDVVGKALNTHRLANYRFMIEGHADPRGVAERNQRLSEGRAEAVRRYLVQHQKVSADRLQAIGKGDREPLNRENPAAPENRRVTFVNLSQ